MKVSGNAVVAVLVAAALALLAGAERERRRWLREAGDWSARLAKAAGGRASAPGAADDSRDQTAAAIDAGEKRLAELEAEFRSLEAATRARDGDPARWNAPPANWPRWEPDSPYVWLPREIVSTLPLASAAFGPDGSLAPGAAGLLGLGDDALDALDRRLAGIVDAIHEAERTRARLVVPAPAETATATGRTRTLRIDPDPELADALRARFSNALVEALGPGRAAFLHDAADVWIRKPLLSLEGQGLTISVTSKADGMQTVFIRSTSGSSSSTGRGLAAVMVPPYLLPLLSADDGP